MPSVSQAFLAKARSVKLVFDGQEFKNTDTHTATLHTGGHRRPRGRFPRAAAPGGGHRADTLIFCLPRGAPAWSWGSLLRGPLLRVQRGTVQTSDNAMQSGVWPAPHRIVQVHQGVLHQAPRDDLTILGDVFPFLTSMPGHTFNAVKVVLRTLCMELVQCTCAVPGAECQDAGDTVRVDSILV
jgi:hypothetical protein